MANPNLDQARALAPVTTTSQIKAFEFDSRPDKIWLNPISMSQLQRAVKENRKSVVLNGREFVITYGIKLKMKASGDEREVIKLKRKDGVMAPFGYVSLARILSFEFEDKE